MKRIYVCIGIVVLLLAAAFYSSFRVQQFAEDISDDIDTAMEELNTIFQSLSAQMYGQQGGDAQQGTPGAGQQTTTGGSTSADNSGEGDVKDADFEEV